MLMAITRTPVKDLSECELTHLDRERISAGRAAQQHQTYRDVLTSWGIPVLNLPSLPGLPDSVFVEDPVHVLPELAIVNHMGAPSRRPEAPSLAAVLRPYRELRELAEPATLDGGDVFRVDRTLYVGQSTRTNGAAIEQLREILGPFDYQVQPVGVPGCLHLKTGCSHLGNRVLLTAVPWVETEALREFEILPVPAEEELFAANVLVVGEKILMPEGYPRTEELLVSRGYEVQTIAISEFEKAEAGLTCMSVLFDGDGLPGEEPERGGASSPGR